MKIEVGEYIRTKQGDISKVRYVDEEYIFLKDCVWSKNDLYEKIDVLYFDDEEIAKHSKNIIDLIEVGDYINGNRVEKSKYGRLYISFNYYGGDIDLQCETYTLWIKDLINNDIHSIVTKEQFNNMEYRL